MHDRMIQIESISVSCSANIYPLCTPRSKSICRAWPPSQFPPIDNKLYQTVSELNLSAVSARYQIYFHVNKLSPSSPGEFNLRVDRSTLHRLTFSTLSLWLRSEKEPLRIFFSLVSF